MPGVAAIRGVSRGCVIVERVWLVLGRSGNDLLSRALRHSTIGAEAFNGRVRDGIGFGRLAQVTGPAKDKRREAERMPGGAIEDCEIRGTLAAFATASATPTPVLSDRGGRDKPGHDAGAIQWSVSR